MLMPLVSVIIPTYNHAQYIGLAIESVLYQSYPNLEILVVDDGSSDGTRKVVEPYLTHIKYIYKQNGGTSSALNWGIGKTSGKYICWLSADDMFLPDKVAKQVAQMEADQNLGFVYTSFMVIDAFGGKQYEIHPPCFKDQRAIVVKLLEGCFINGSSVMMRKSALQKVGGFDEKLPQAHDYDLWLRFLRSYTCGFLDDILLAYRWHGENMSQSPDALCDREVRERAIKLFPEWLK